MGFIMKVVDISVSLKYGKNPNKLFVWALIAVPFSLFASVMTVVIHIVTLWEGCLYVYMIVIPALALSVFMLILSARMRKQLIEWSKDAVLLDAKIIKIDSYNLQMKTWTKICVKFTYNSEKYEICSGDENYHGFSKGFKAGYAPEFDKVLGYRKILYSPKYQQVMVVKR